jgi:hypothetical protein
MFFLSFYFPIVGNHRVRDSGWKRRMIMVFNAMFNNISVISWRLVLLVEETGENHRPITSHWQTLSHNFVSSAPIQLDVTNIDIDWRKRCDFILRTLIFYSNECYQISAVVWFYFKFPPPMNVATKMQWILLWNI